MDCQSCAIQIVYGVDSTDQGCLFDSARDDTSGAMNFPDVYPGAEHDATFTLTAPTTLGVHEVRVSQNEQFTCTDATNLNTLVSRPDITRIGVLIVQ
jgi:hypothetical protein